MSDKLIFNCTYGKEDPERATLPFVAANIAATAGQDAVVLCTIDAVWLGTDGGTDGIAQPGLPAPAPSRGQSARRWCRRVPPSLARPRWSRRLCRGQRL